MRRGLADHVLASFDKDERDEVERMTARAADAAEMFITSGIAAVMNGFNGGDSRTDDSRTDDPTTDDPTTDDPTTDDPTTE
jgi:hypothetical protein